MPEEHHDYHLVEPSALPIVSSLCVFAFFAGLAMFMHEIIGGKWLMIGGFGGILVCMKCWWKEVIREGIEDKSHTPIVRHGLRLGMILFIASELMFFVAFFWAFFSSSIYPKLPLDDTWDILAGFWPPEGIHTFDAWDLPFINTLILLLSGTTVGWAHHALLHDNLRDVKRGLWLTVILGFIFTCLQAVEYGHAAFSLTDGIYASTFYLATGFHGIHVIIGTIFLAVNLRRAYSGTLTKEGHLGFEFAAWYWHFVDVVWVFLFIFVYWWGG